MSKLVEPAEHRCGLLRVKIGAIRAESLAVEANQDPVRELSLVGTIPDDLGVEALAGRPVTISLRSGLGGGLEPNLDALHGITDGLSIGVISVERRHTYVGAHLPNSTVSAIASLMRRGLNGGEVFLEVIFASRALGRLRTVEPRHLLQSPLRRAAVLRLRWDNWATDPLTWENGEDEAED